MKPMRLECSSTMCSSTKIAWAQEAGKSGGADSRRHPEQRPPCGGDQAAVLHLRVPPLPAARVPPVLGPVGHCDVTRVRWVSVACVPEVAGPVREGSNLSDAEPTSSLASLQLATLRLR